MRQPNPAILQRVMANPVAASAADIFALQRMAGNRAVSNLFAGNAPLAMQPVIQARFKNDPVTDISTEAAQFKTISAPAIQRRIMTDKELVKMTGVKGARFRAGSSYERLVEYLKDYRKLEAEDTQGKKKNKRLEILGYIETEIEAWRTSGARKKVKKGDEKKAWALVTLHGQVRAERSKISGIKEELAKSQDPKRWRYAIRIGSTSKEEVRKKALDGKNFWAKVGQKIKNFFHYTFGTDFTSEGTVALKGDYLNEDEIKEIIKRMDEAEQWEKKLIAEGGVSPVAALGLAYAYMPEQLKPKSPAPEAKLAIKVKRQLLQESLDKTKSKKTTEEKAQKYMGYIGYVPKAASVVNTGVAKIGKKVLLSKDAPGEQIKKFQTDTKISAAGINIVGDIVTLAKSITGIVDGSKKYAKAKTALQKQEAMDTLQKSIIDTIKAGGSVNNNLSTALNMGKGIPVVSILTTIQKLIVNIFEGIKQVYRAVKQHKVQKEAKKQASALKGAIKRLGKRNIHLIIRTGVDIVANVLSMVATLLGGPTNPYGAAVKTIATVVSGLNTVGQLLVDSYRAGIAQEAEFQAQTGQGESEVKVFKRNTVWALTGIIVEAKEGNALAKKTLAIYNITEKMLKESSVADIRKYVLGQLQEESELETLTQKALTGIRGRKK